MICDQRLVDMDEEELVDIIKQPDGSMVDTPVPVARNGGAGPVRSNAQGSKSASASDRARKFKKQQQAPPKYVRPEKWKIVRRYRTCIRARFDNKTFRLTSTSVPALISRDQLRA